MQEESGLIADAADGIMTVTLRHRAGGALDGPGMGSFERMLLRFRDAADLSVMLVQGGGDFYAAEPNPAPEAAPGARAIRERARNAGLQRIFDEMEHVEKPIVMALRGGCTDAGLELALSGDFRLAADDARFGFPGQEGGALPGSNGISRLTRICGPHWARWLVMANKPADAAMAYTMGLVHKVWPAEDFDEKVLEFCRHLAKQNGEQMGAAKIAIELASEIGRDSARHVERMTNSALMLNPDYLARIDSYVRNIGGRKA